MQLVMVGNQHQRSYGNKNMKAQNTINLGKISGEIKTWNNFILGSKGLKEIGTIKRFYSVYDVYYGLLHFIQPSVITKCGFIPEKRS